MVSLMFKRMAALLLFALTVAACGSTNTAAPQPTTAPAATTVPAATAAPAATDAPAPTDAPAATAAPAATDAPAAERPADGARTITDATGQEIAVPVDPQRVVVLSEQDLDGTLALGITPVGTVNGRGQKTPPLYLGERAAAITSVGDFSQPSLEKVVELKPDLILIGGIFPQIEALLPDLRTIAPTVVTYALTDDWKTAFRGTANALNKAEEAEKFLADYDARTAAIKTALGANAGTEVSIVRWNPQGPGIMATGSFSSLVLTDLGFKRPASQQQIEGFSHSEPLSLEQLEQIDGDWLFLGTLNADGTKALEEARTQPLFQQLDAVKNNHVVNVDGTFWTSRGGPLAALIILDDVEKSVK
ncbi:MAG TPA: iron-siderophore ABC transporter substrate-binding protein [Roseiflexaceae bacterium]|nr:iron-siderophore ABC transporter substrate-binding protein [Roseiflexaceae bacterium]